MKQADTPKFTNKLIHETSPYLLQHAHNPVNWHAWGHEAFEKAKNENKLVLVSIGYAACHWCHVMEHESFEDERIAAIMNQNYVCIKVDREERPDVDQVYMTAVQLLTGSGGWPLNCFTLPDGRPVYGGTYYRPGQWTQVLEALATTFHQEKDKVLQVANDLAQGIQAQELVTQKKPFENFSEDYIHWAVQNWERYFDNEWGGNQRAPKFPMPSGYQFLLDYAHRFKQKDIQQHLELTLKKMARGGIYDQVGGGFSRYSVDAQWKVPHFEKMLYDNGQLISLYANACKFTKNPLHQQVVEQTLDFILREMMRNDGAFYASFDADSEGVEGKFYVWSKEEIESVLRNEATWFCPLFNVSEKGNWEGSNILWITNVEAVKNQTGWSDDILAEQVKQAMKKLFAKRKQRVHPALDDKVLTSWNALMALGFVDANEAFGNPLYLNVALKNATFIKNNLWKSDGRLHRNHKMGKSNIEALLDDYALVIQLFTRLYQTTFNLQWLADAERLCSYVIENFEDETSGMFFYTNKKFHELMVRKMELADNVIPSSNSIMAQNLFVLGTLLSKTDYIDKARQMVANTLPDIEQNAAYYGNWAQVSLKFVQPVYQVVFMGPDSLKLKNYFCTYYHPRVIIAGADHAENSNELPLLQDRWSDHETLIYVCEGNVCQLPVKTVEEALQLIDSSSKR
ncbi:MAG: thioredoxin domain-containing protein [Salinivirgaceae bacterium]